MSPKLDGIAHASPGRNPGAHFWVRAPKSAGEEVWPHDWDVMWWDGEYFWGTNGDGYKADSLVIGPRVMSPEEQVAPAKADGDAA